MMADAPKRKCTSPAKVATSDSGSWCLGIFGVGLLGRLKVFGKMK